MFKKIILCFIAVALVSAQSFGQQKDISKMTRADIMAMSYEELAELPIEDVMQLTKILGISLDEFYEMLLNKDVTSASKKAESSFESPLSTTVLSYDEIVSSGARNIQEALRLVPGVIVREKTNGNYCQKGYQAWSPYNVGYVLRYEQAMVSSRIENGVGECRSEKLSKCDRTPQHYNRYGEKQLCQVDVLVCTSQFQAYQYDEYGNEI